MEASGRTGKRQDSFANKRVRWRWKGVWDGWVSPGWSLSLVPSTEPACQPCSCPLSPRSMGLCITGPWRTDRRARGDLQLQPWGRRRRDVVWVCG